MYPGSKFTPFEIVQRERLFRLIDDPDLAPITLITAPAGYGKSTIAHQWIARHPERAFGWHQVRAEHNSIGSFLTQLWRAIDAATAEESPATEISLGAVLERLRRLSDPIVLVLDDYHLIENVLVHSFVKLLLADLPETTRIVMLSRTVPDLALARLHAYGRVRQLSQDDLAFRFEEVKQIFAGKGVSDDLLQRLTQRSEGWIAGIQLALISVNLDSTHASEQLARLIAAMSEDRLLNDYIVQEALDSLPDDLRRFVLDTVALEVLEPELCNAVLQIDSSDLMLERLEHAIVFVGRPGGVGAPLTYHRLFAECVQRLRQRKGIQPSATELRLRAAEWYRARGELEVAAEYALGAGSWELAKELMRQFLPESLPHINVWKALYWLRRLPEPVMRMDTELFQIYAHTLLANGLYKEARPLVEAMAGGEAFDLTPHQQGWLASHLAVVASADGHRDEALHQSYRALSLLPMDDTIVRLLAWSYVYREETSRGDRALGQMVLQHAAINRERHPRASVCWHFVLEPMIANDLAIQGDLLGAEQLIHHFVANIPAEIGSFAGKFRLRLLQIYLEQNRLDLAGIEAELILEEMNHRLYGPWFPEAFVAIANCRLANGDAANAKKLFDRALELSNEQGGRHHFAMTDAAIANYWLHTGQHQLAHFWAARTPVTPYLAREFGEIEPRTVRLRLLLLEQSPTDARTLVDESLAEARSAGHVAAEITFLVWSSVIARASGDSAPADDDLRQALELGAPGRFARIFASTGIDLSDSIRALLPALSVDARCHARTLLGEPGQVEVATDVASWNEAGLTGREREVLAELISGKSNREIAEALYITERTVKKHLASLFRKSGASNRMMLALWAQEQMTG